MRFRSRLTLLLALVLVGPVVGGILAGHSLAVKRSLAVVDGRLAGASVGIERALDAQAKDARNHLRPDVARHAFDARGSQPALEEVRRSARLDYVVVEEASAPPAWASRTPSFSASTRVTATFLGGDPRRAGFVSDFHVRLVRPDGTAATVWGGLFRDRTFLLGLGVPAVTVARGRIVASTTAVPAGSRVGPGGPFDLSRHLRALCVCDRGSRPSGVALVESRPAGDALPTLGGAVIVVLAVTLSLGLVIAWFLARLVSRPIQRLAETASASVQAELGPAPQSEAPDEVARIDGAIAKLRTSLRQTSTELDGSLEALRRAEAQLNDQERLSLSDSLTGAWNRRYLEMALADAMQRGTRKGHPFALLMIDLDRFKDVNDTHGHQRGDEVLVETCERIRGSLRAGLDVLARYGGEEFVVLLPETDRIGSRAVAGKISKLIRGMPFGLADDPIRITVSIGVASYPDDATTPDDLLSKADANLYRAKRAGRDRVASGDTMSAGR